MNIQTTKWDVTESLESKEDIAAYLDVVFEEGDADEILRALGHVARAKGMTSIAREANVSRETLYKALGDNGNPTMGTLMSVLKAFGLRLSVAA